MVFKNEKWRIKSFTYGWLIQKRVGSQWKETQYFRSLDQAATNLLDQQIHEQTTDISIDTINQLETIRLCKELNARINQVRDEILGVFHA